MKYQLLIILGLWLSCASAKPGLDIIKDIFQGVSTVVAVAKGQELPSNVKIEQNYQNIPINPGFSNAAISPPPPYYYPPYYPGYNQQNMPQQYPPYYGPSAAPPNLPGYNIQTPDNNGYFQRLAVQDPPYSNNDITAGPLIDIRKS